MFQEFRTHAYTITVYVLFGFMYMLYSLCICFFLKALLDASHSYMQIFDSIIAIKLYLV